ncbi:MAG: SRPBCC domain-containing protein [Gammaproteobacteria bacterium]|nr:SRPBCC domain-containing protein [Gammaproteobacteria bacterium]MDH3374886.1 SRPBCC domain-containing protein [Gammaproteobacteria bacterium]MDH3409783.1 SRPBCC domain-containing protein [Gammaproteobacteria bacterium]MDH3553481.1 SRPBCC domain-containing protein [Gammaproteobacteria bacterium]
MEAVFKALADGSRRRVLDALFDRDGQTLQALGAHVDFTRQGLSKHLRILEDAGLVITEFQGREKKHYLNPVPIHEVTERWIAKYAREQLVAISALKQSLEGVDMNNKEFAYQTYINAPREKVWEALTNAEFTAKYFYATRVQSTWDPGAVVEYLNASGDDVVVEGKVIEADAPDKLVITWHVLYDEAAMKEAPSRVTFSLEDVGGQTRLRIVHDQFPEDTVLFDSISDGWPWILASLKSLLETGDALPLPEQRQQAAAS